MGWASCPPSQQSGTNALSTSDRLLPTHQTQSMTDRQTLDQWLDLAVDRLEQAIAPEQILLFGSWARGTASRHSDIDLFIVWNTAIPPLERIGQVLSLLQDSPLPIEVIVYTLDELEQRCYSPFIRRVLSEGKVLYERGQT
ncbi:nucleotidyltransferase domain-containing protein [Egbenema bharatensis]|uniref:nucleotidyltransferase domain-containing protein n=1 Tax=Egbenema bharatensis TaxID=3463334 RepID=UPI003A83FBEA